ncbi:phospholipase D-like domain-containing protein [Sphingomonas radiodurans]|uniref:phospholipase D-like domain-containing protein n=1 Tax=Sphingomonas radiodurans TaxID=2890321 RepID=UPI001E591710|nr:phospholipase D-like domain-containing protein [Sphingomonas radiodurans]WBH18368.1 phospholipase D-like domain-containing protein [Sphingomonas radiodurans]
MTLPEQTRWRVEQASRAAVVVDADNYFRLAREAMMKANHQILLIGWDFDARINLAWEDEPPGVPTTVGEFISWLTKRQPDLNVYILRWDKGAMKTLFRGKTLWTLTKWRFMRKRIHLLLDGHHPVGASHHQKIVVIDDRLAFCGGIDMTDERWDTRAHRDNDPHRTSPRGRPHKPWHDATTALEGPVAVALGELCRTRWSIAGGATIPPPPPTSDCWPGSLTPDFHDVSVAISRSQPAHGNQEAIHEIEELYLSLIARAQRSIYAESQYFASRRVAEAIARRLDEPDGPEIVIVNPVTAQGWLEPIAMDTARARLMQALKQRDRHGRLRMYHPHTLGGTPIYVHAKVLVIDDDLIRVGSSNFNNRSLRLDTECDVTIEHDGDRIAAIRDDLIAEHLDTDPATVTAAIAEHGLIGAIERLRGHGKTLVPYEVPDLSTVEKWLADNKILDPEGPEEMFELPSARPRLLARLKRFRHRRVA